MPHATEQVKGTINDAADGAKGAVDQAKGAADDVASQGKNAANGGFDGFNSSKTVSHLTSYPAVSDSIDSFKSNPYGKKSLEIVDGAYARFAKPVEPYLETPYSYAKPYVSKVDELGDRALKGVDGHFPIFQEKTDTIIEKAKSTVFWPYTYLSEAWSDEYKKTVNHNNRGEKLSSTVLAVVSLELRVASDFFHFVADNLHQTVSKADEYTKDAQNKASDLAGKAQKTGEDYYNKASKTAKDATNDASKTAEDLKNSASKTAKDASNTASKKADEYTDAASKKADEAKHSASKTADDAKHEANKTKDKVTK